MSPAKKTVGSRSARSGAVKRKTKETNIDVSLRLDSGGKAKVST